MFTKIMNTAVVVALHKTMNISNLLRILIQIKYVVSYAIKKEKLSRLYQKLVKMIHDQVLGFFSQ